MRSGSKIPILFGLGFLILCFSWLLSAQDGRAASFSQAEAPTPTPVPAEVSGIEGNIVSDQVCLSCHGQPGITKNLIHGESLDLFISPEQYRASIHGSLGYACVQCHVDYMQIPHTGRRFADLREVTIVLSAETCARCHTRETENVLNSVHAIAMSEGQREAAVCGDCHHPHTSPRLSDPLSGELTPAARLQIPQTCAQCHYAIYDIYRTSVHGSALIVENNTDVPTCIDCHGVHNITDPTTEAFRLASPQICASCHTDADMMGKYGLSTEVLNTYVADFHGTTVTLFDQRTPDAETNKPVCLDCHGVHDIASATNPEKGLAVRENLLARCRTCHPDATENFSDAWLSHYIPDPEHTPLVYYVTLFYKFFIPGVLGGMALLVALDLQKLFFRRLKKLRLVRHPPSTDMNVVPPVEEIPPASSPDQATPEDTDLANVLPVDEAPLELSPEAAPETTVTPEPPIIPPPIEEALPGEQSPSLPEADGEQHHD